MLRISFAGDLLLEEWLDSDIVHEKELMQEKLIAVAYTLGTYCTQFSLGEICKQEWVYQCSSSIRGG